MVYYSYCREKILIIKIYLNVINKMYRIIICDDLFFYIDLYYIVFFKRLYSVFFIYKEECL